MLSNTLITEKPKKGQVFCLSFHMSYSKKIVHEHYFVSKRFADDTNELLHEIYASRKSFKNHALQPSETVSFLENLKNFKTFEQIAREYKMEVKTLKEILKLCWIETAAFDKKHTFKCQVCGKNVVRYKALSPNRYLENINNYGRPRQYKYSAKIQKKWQPFLHFITQETKLYNKYKNAKNLSLRVPKKSAQQLIDEFKKISNKDVFIPTPSTLYKFMKRNEFIIPYDIFTYKSIGKSFRSKSKRHKPKKKTVGKTIHERPKEINDRLTLNDYEMDTVHGNIKSKKVILTLINRLTRKSYAIISSLNARAIKRALEKLIARFNLKIDTLTIDNGSENYMLDKIKCIKQIFHTDAFASSQKGSIENMHKLIREYVPKGKSFDCYSDDEIWSMMDKINNIVRHNINQFPFPMSANAAQNFFQNN